MDVIIPERGVKGLAPPQRMGQEALPFARLSFSLSLSGQVRKARRDQHAQKEPPLPLLSLPGLEYMCTRHLPHWDGSFPRLAASSFQDQNLINRTDTLLNIPWEHACYFGCFYFFNQC